MRKDARSRRRVLPMSLDLSRRSGRPTIISASSRCSKKEFLKVVLEVDAASSTITPTSAHDRTHDREVHLAILRIRARTIVLLAAVQRALLDCGSRREIGENTWHMKNTRSSCLELFR